MKVLVTGGNGQLGQSINKVMKQFPSFNVTFTDQHDLDITDLDQLKKEFVDKKYQAVINCAAYTAVDKAEEQEDIANLVNKTGPENLAKTCKEFDALLVHISTDYVFAGDHAKPILPNAPYAPKSAYGRSKANGEMAIREIDPAGTIIRTSWLYSEFGNNFVKTMIRLGKERDLLKVVADQIGSPCYGPDLAKACLRVLEKHQHSPLDKVELYHFANAGCASWYDFTKAIHEKADIACKVLPISTEEYPLPAERPSYSVLNCKSFEEDFGVEIPYWRDSLQQCINELA